MLFNFDVTQIFVLELGSKAMLNPTSYLPKVFVNFFNFKACSSFRFSAW